MRRVTLRIAEEDLELALDGLLPLLPRGIHERRQADGTVELLAFGADDEGMPPRAVLVPAARVKVLAYDEAEAPPDPEARHRLISPAWVAGGGRLLVRGPDDASAPGAMEEIVIGRRTGFGPAHHPSARLTLEALLAIRPGGPLVDARCGSGLIAIAAARLGFAPVTALDADPGALAETRENARRNGVEVDVRLANPLTDPLPDARVLVADLYGRGQLALARRVTASTDTVLAGGFALAEAGEVAAAYAGAGLDLTGAREEGRHVVLELGRPAA